MESCPDCAKNFILNCLNRQPRVINSIFKLSKAINIDQEIGPHVFNVKLIYADTSPSGIQK
jgi:hypothetical protein